MKILVLWKVKDGADIDAIKALLVEEERFASRTYLADELREHYASDFPTPAISVLEMESVEAAKARFAELSLFKAGFLEARYHELRPFANWEVLFRDGEKVASVSA